MTRLRPALTALCAALAPLPVLADPITFSCTFDWVCDTQTCAAADLRLRIRLDSSTSEATIPGQTDPASIAVFIGDRAVSFVEVPISGGVRATTVKLATGEAVHSRNRIDGTDLTPDQYLGTCSIS
ncbi:hypothetical protein [Actibacterium sp. D379-3]